MSEKQILNCFRYKDGMWHCVSGVTINSPGGGSVQIGPGMSFGGGVSFSGINLAALLAELAAKYGYPPVV